MYSWAFVWEKCQWLSLPANIEEQGPDLHLYLKKLKSETKYTKQWFSDTEQMATESSDPWEKGYKLFKFYGCSSLLPGESFQTTTQGERIQREPRVLSELKRQARIWRGQGG